VLTEVVFPAGVRVDTWVETGSEVPPYYDPLLAKLIVRAPTRDAVVEAAARWMPRAWRHRDQSRLPAQVVRDATFAKAARPPATSTDFATAP
jgi:urea carboxylase